MIKAQTLTYYDFFEMQDLVEEKIGHDLRDLGKYFHPEASSPPYMDFWHWQVDHGFFDKLQNDSICQLYIGVDEFEESWQLEIQKIWYELFKDVADEYDIIWVWVCW